MKFAKLFDVADTQVLFEAKPDEQGSPAIHVTTIAQGSALSLVYTMDAPTKDLAWAQAYDNINDVVDQQIAEDEYAKILKAFAEEAV